MSFNFFKYMYVFFVVVLFDCGVESLRESVKGIVGKGWAHRNPYNLEWFLGPAPEYAKIAREERQVRQWYAL